MIIERIRANGGEVIRHGWTFKLRRGRLTDTALTWIKQNQDDLFRDQWPEYDEFRAMVADLVSRGIAKEEAEPRAYAVVMEARKC